MKTSREQLIEQRVERIKKNEIHAYERLLVEDSQQKIGNRFDHVLCAAQRARQLLAGRRATIDIGSDVNVTAIREIANGTYGRELLMKIKT